MKKVKDGLSRRGFALTVGLTPLALFAKSKLASGEEKKEHASYHHIPKSRDCGNCGDCGKCADCGCACQCSC